MAEAAPPEESLLDWLDGPRLVVGAFALFMVGVLGLLLLLWDGQRDQVERIDAIVMERLAETKAANYAQVNDCFANSAQGPALQRALRAFEDEVAPKARRALRDFIDLNKLNTPSLAECRQLASSLNLPVPRRIR